MAAQPEKLGMLSVYMDDVLVGSLYDEDPLAFSYDAAWLGRVPGMPLHDTIPLTEGHIATPQVHAFFENLLPEGDQRKILSLRYHVTSIFGLLAVAGGDTAGALVLLPHGARPAKPAYQPMSWQQVDQLIHAESRPDEPEEEEEQGGSWMPETRVSISGAQFKLLLSFDPEGNPLRPLGTAPSTHILKPDMVRGDMKLFATAVNETIVMRAAGLCGLPVARASYRPEVGACLIERYDRRPRDDGSLRRLWQADFCQLAGTPSTRKYEADGGPSFRECFALLKAHSVRPAVDQRNLLRWLFFNLYVGNNDSHAKNISMLATDDGLRLAPFYDMMSTRVYPGLGASFSFQIGDEYVPGKIGPEHLERFAASLEIAPRYLRKTASEMAQAVIAAIPVAVDEILPLLGHSEKVLAERLRDKIGSIAKKTCARLMPSPEGNHPTAS
ncbi:MAG TPA: type II toxin-antitoxin system HipA family toxin [Noviherbaspirillum sp.]|nr:type II toxin-antitoxin system HipA family toxin [Noviherbaspirillum sp.]